MDTVISLLVTSVAGILSGMVLFLLQRHFKLQQKKEEMRDREKAMQMSLIIKSLNTEKILPQYVMTIKSITTPPIKLINIENSGLSCLRINDAIHVNKAIAIILTISITT